MVEYVNVFDRKISLVETRELAKIIVEIANKPNQSVFFCNAHMLMLSLEDNDLAVAMGNADWVFADGVPVSWLQSRISRKSAAVIRGYEIMLAVCERAATTGEKVGFLGSTKNVLTALVGNLYERYHGINIVYQYCPSFMEDELTSTQEELQNLTDSKVEWLFVGLGCPKQEKWIAKYKGELNCHVLGVGAAFDWISGQVSMPPKWMESSGLGWFYRLLNNPRKLWRRYTIYNSKFLVEVIKRSFKKK